MKLKTTKMAAEFKMANVRLNLLSWCDFRFTKPERNNGDYDNESDSNELVKKKKKNGFCFTFATG